MQELEEENARLQSMVSGSSVAPLQRKSGAADDEVARLRAELAASAQRADDLERALTQTRDLLTSAQPPPSQTVVKVEDEDDDDDESLDGKSSKAGPGGSGVAFMVLLLSLSLLQTSQTSSNNSNNTTNASAKNAPRPFAFDHNPPPTSGLDFDFDALLGGSAASGLDWDRKWGWSAEEDLDALPLSDDFRNMFGGDPLGLSLPQEEPRQTQEEAASTVAPKAKIEFTLRQPQASIAGGDRDLSGPFGSLSSLLPGSSTEFEFDFALPTAQDGSSSSLLGGKFPGSTSTTNTVRVKLLRDSASSSNSPSSLSSLDSSVSTPTFMDLDDDAGSASFSPSPSFSSLTSMSSAGVPRGNAEKVRVELRAPRGFEGLGFGTAGGDAWEVEVRTQ